VAEADASKSMTSAARVPFVAATVAAALPIAVAAVRGMTRGWEPTGDDAYSAVRAHDVLTRRPPLLGTWSSASLFTHHQVNHPGPLQFDLLAVPVRIAGAGPGTALGMALVNVTAVVLLGWLVSRRLGTTTALVALAFTAVLTWSMGSEMLYDPWSQHAPLLPFALFLVAVWAVLAGDVVALPIAVASGSYVLQTHLSYIVLVPAFMALAVGTMAVRRQFRWLGLGLGVGLLCWAQPLIEQVTQPFGEGNLAALWRSRTAEAPKITPGGALRVVGGTVAIPPAWLPPSFGHPSFHLDYSGRPTWLAIVALVTLAAALAFLGWRAWRRGSTAVVAGTVLGLVALPLALVTVLSAPMRLGAAPTYLRWLWPLGMVVWLALAAALVDEAQRRERVARTLPMVALGVTVVAAAVTGVHRVDNGTGSPPWTIEAAQVLDDGIVEALRGHDTVLIELSFDVTTGAVGPAVFTRLQERGIAIYVRDPDLVRQLGTARRFSPDDTDIALTIRGDAVADHPGKGERRVASWRGDPADKHQRVAAYVRALTD